MPEEDKLNMVLVEAGIGEFGLPRSNVEMGRRILAGRYLFSGLSCAIYACRSVVLYRNHAVYLSIIYLMRMLSR